MTSEAGQSAVNSGATLKITHLSVRFGGVNAISDVGFQAKGGLIVGIIGPNGAGKTTILNSICGVVRCTGDIALDNRNLRQMPIHRLREAGVARSFQHPQLDPKMTVAQHLAVGLIYRRPYGWIRAAMGPLSVSRTRSQRAERQEVERMVTLLSLKPWADTKIADAAYGVQKLTDIGRAMMGNPSLLLLDEPFAGLSSQEQADLVGIIREQQGQLRTTILLIDHHVEMVASAVNELLAVVAGKVVAHGRPSAVLADETVMAAYLG